MASGGGFPKYVAEASSHEAGHAFGLAHQSTYDSNGNKTNEYNPGAGEWGPIMGVAYGRPLSTWHQGPNAVSSTTLQDDIAVLASTNNSFGLMVDDHADVRTAATPMDNSHGGGVTVAGRIERTADTDYFSFVTAGGTVHLSVAGINIGTNLDVVVRLFDSNATQIAIAQPTGSFNASVTAQVSPGAYALAVSSTGGYGYTGRYIVTGNVGTPGGDSDGDGCASGADYTIWADNFGLWEGNATISVGDFNGDGFVSGADYTIWADVFSISPNAPSNLRVANAWGDSIDVNWSDNASSEAGFQLQLATDPDFMQVDQTQTTTANDIGARFSNLQPSTLYFIRVRALGTCPSPWSSVVSVVSDGAPAAPSNLRSANIWARTIDANWDDNANNEEYFQAQISSDPGFTVILDSRYEPVDDVGVRFDNLQPATNYWIRVRAVSHAGPSNWSNDLFVVTQGPPNAPSNLRTDNVFAQAVDLRWDDNSNNEDAFYVAISTDGGQSWNNAAITATNDTGVRVSGLQPATNYWFQVRAGNSEGFSPYSNVIQVTTRDTTPSAPSNLRTDNVFRFAVDLRWDDNSNNEAEFIVYMATSANGTFLEVARTIANDTGIRISGLQNDRMYWFRVRASNSAGQSADSNTLKITTKP